MLNGNAPFFKPLLTPFPHRKWVDTTIPSGWECSVFAIFCQFPCPCCSICRLCVHVVPLPFPDKHKIRDVRIECFIFCPNIILASNRMHFALQHFLPYKTIKSHAFLLLFQKLFYLWIFNQGVRTSATESRFLYLPYPFGACRRRNLSAASVGP